MIITIDLALFSWVLLLNGVGFWLNRTKVRKWAIPIPLLLLFLGVMLTTVWGCVLSPPASFKDFVGIATRYGIPNGVLAVFIAVCCYDIVHEFSKRESNWTKILKTCLSVFERRAK